MAALHLTLSEAFSPEVADRLARALDCHIDTETPEIYCRKTSEPDILPQFIHMVGQWQLWQTALGYEAKLFVNQLGRRRADIAWEEAEHALQRPEIAPLAEIADAIAATRDTVAQEASIIVGLNLPNNRFGTVMVIEDSRPVKIAYAIARFVDRAEDIVTVIEHAVAVGEMPRGPALLSFEDDGVMVRWNSRADMRVHEQRLPL
jgi:hypothetical protein